VAIITPFNFPLEIPALQLMGALFMGNKVLLHVDRRCPRQTPIAPCCAGAYVPHRIRVRIQGQGLFSSRPFVAHLPTVVSTHVRRVSIVAEQLLRLLHHCGAPTTDVDLVREF